MSFSRLFLGRRQHQKCGMDTHGERGVRAYNRDLAMCVESQLGPRSKPLITGRPAFGCLTEATKFSHSPNFAMF